MKDYKEVTSEILKRRDAHRTYIKRLKKRIVVLLAVFTVCLSVGAGAWMMSRSEAQVTPDMKDTGVTLPVDTEELTIQTGNVIPPPNIDTIGSNEGFWSENRLDLPAHYIIKDDGDIPDELMTYTVDNGDRYLVDNNYEAGVDKE